MIAQQLRLERNRFEQTGSLLPRPACGERVGVRGTLGAFGLADSPPHRDHICDVIRPLPASGARWPNFRIEPTQSYGALIGRGNGPG